MRKIQMFLAGLFFLILPYSGKAQSAPPAITLSPSGTQYICNTGKDTLYYSLSASNIPAGTNVVIYQGADSLFNPYAAQGDSIAYVPGQSIPRDTLNFGACVKIIGQFIDACGPSGQEGRNEYIVLTSGNGFSVNSLGIDFSSQNNTSGASNNDININTNPCGYKTPNAGLIANLRQGSCNASNVIPASPGDIIPPNVIVVVFTSDSVSANYSLNGLCNKGYPVYILQSACVRTIGAFTNAPRCDAPSRYRTTRAVDQAGSCSSSFTYDLCGIFDQDGTYAIRQEGTDTASVANNGIRRNTIDSCGGIDYTQFSFSSDTLLKYPLQNPNVDCNTTYYLKAITHPNGSQPVSNAIAFQLVCLSLQTQVRDADICSGETANIGLSDSNPNATFSWTAAAGSNISGASGGSGNTISQVLQNTGTQPDSVVYSIVSSFQQCTSSKKVKVIVYPLPQPDITGNLLICNTATTTLSVAGQYDSVRWNTGAATTSINTGQAGNYSVTVYKNGCSGTDNVTLQTQICNDPVDTLYICAGDTVQLNGESGHNSYSWSPAGSLNNSTVEDPLAFPAQTTTYVVQYGGDTVNILTNGNFENGLQDWSTGYALYTNQSPPFGTYSIDSSAQNIYFGYCANPDVTINGSKYLIVDGSTSTTLRILYRTIAVEQNTNYVFEMWAMPISSHPNVPTFDIKFNGGVVVNDLVLDTTTCLWKKYTYNWNSASATSLNLEIIDVRGTGQGNDFALDEIALKTSAISADSVVVVVNPLPQPDITGNLLLCNSSTTTLSVSGPFDSVRWNTGAATFSISVSQPGNYSVTAYSNGCSGTDAVQVTENIVPVTIAGELEICPNGNTTLTVNGQYDSVRWNTQETTLNILVSQAGTYTVTAYVNGCSGSASVTVDEVTAPQAFNLGNDTLYCGPFTRVLNSGNTTTQWSTQATGAQITVTSPGTYTATVSNTCGTFSDTIVISQAELPQVDLGADTTICEGEIFLEAPADYQAYQWSTGAQSSSITVTSPGVYFVTVTDNNGCQGSDTLLLELSCDNSIFIPNAFSPNGDQVNDVFYVRGNPRNVNIQRMTIFDRWGEKIFETANVLPDDPQQGWDGSYKNKPAQKDVYAYRVVVKFANGEEKSYNGNLTLLR